MRWSVTRTGCSGTCPSRIWDRARPRRSPCWPWSPARTSNRSRAATAPTGDGRSPGGSPRTGSSPPSTPTPGTRTRPVHHGIDGFKAHIEVEPDTGLIPECALTRAGGPDTGDATVGIALLTDDDTIDGPVEVLGDSAYGTGEALDTLDRAGHTAVIKPWPLRPAVPGGFTLDDFTVDEAAGTVTCPARGDPADHPQPDGDLRRGLPRLPAARPLHHRADGGPCSCIEHDALQRAHRARAAEPDFQATYAGTGRWSNAPGLAHPRPPAGALPGSVKNDAWLHLRVAAINLRRLLTLGLTRAEGNGSSPPPEPGDEAGPAATHRQDRQRAGRPRCPPRV